jgi:hypothetical protein
MRFSFGVLFILLVTAGALPVMSNPVYVHNRTHKAKRHKVPKHHSVQGLLQPVDQQLRQG